MQPPTSVLAPLNDRLIFLNEDGSRRESVIAAFVADRLDREDYEGAKSYVEARVDGELQIYQQRVEIRAAGDTSVADMLAQKAHERLKRVAEIRAGEPFVTLIAAE
jgi:hypothetical protein